jgi:uncharacterized protein
VTEEPEVSVVGSVTRAWRYPVKSLVGEEVAVVEVDGRGVVGDRRWAVTDADGKLGSGKSTRRFRRMDGLLQLAASYDEDGTPVLAFPDGRRLDARDPGVDAALSDHVGRPVRLRPETSVSHLDEGPLHLVTTASLAALSRHHDGPVSPARMRANLLVDVAAVDAPVEDGWVDRTLALGPEVTIRVRARMPRCVMVELPQVDLPAARGLLATLGRLNDATLGVVADVVTPGTVRVGDEAVLLG